MGGESGNRDGLIGGSIVLLILGVALGSPFMLLAAVVIFIVGATRPKAK